MKLIKVTVEDQFSKGEVDTLLNVLSRLTNVTLLINFVGGVRWDK